LEANFRDLKASSSHELRRNGQWEWTVKQSIRMMVSGLRDDDKGTIGVIFALMAIPMFGMIGMSIDYGRALHTRIAMRQAVDAAVMAAATAGDKSETQRQSTALAVFNANFVPSAFGVSANPQAAVEGSNVRVTATAQVEPTIARIIHNQNFQIEISTSAAIGAGSTSAGGQACLLALEESDYGLKLNGGGTGSHVNTTCGVVVNSSSSAAIFGNSNGTLTSTFTCVNGGVDDDPTLTPAPQTGCQRMADPLASLAAPAVGGCTYTNKKFGKNDNGPLQPGVYCGGLDITNQANATFAPGIYIIKDGQFKMASSASATGNGVFFYLVGNNARIDWGSSSKQTFTAPSSGTYKGMLVWSAEALSNAHRIGSHATSKLQGTIYSPRAEIDIQCSGEVFASGDWTMWVVKQLQMSSHAQLRINSNFATSATPLPDAIANGGLTHNPPVARLNE